MLVSIDHAIVLRIVYRCKMNQLSLSPKFQIVIPKDIREAMGLKPGMKMSMIRFGNRIEVVPIKDMASMRGFTKGIDTNIERESDREI